jgi:Flp pilus assembly protein TadD
VPLSVIGVAHFFKHRFDEAAARLFQAIEESSGFSPSYRVLAACYAHMGRLDEARAVVARLRAITPAAPRSNRPRKSRRTVAPSQRYRSCGE